MCLTKLCSKFVVDITKTEELYWKQPSTDMFVMRSQMNSFLCAGLLLHTAVVQSRHWALDVMRNTRINRSETRQRAAVMRPHVWCHVTCLCDVVYVTCVPVHLSHELMFSPRHVQSHLLIQQVTYRCVCVCLWFCCQLVIDSSREVESQSSSSSQIPDIVPVSAGPHVSGSGRSVTLRSQHSLISLQKSREFGLR